MYELKVLNVHTLFIDDSMAGGKFEKIKTVSSVYKVLHKENYSQNRLADQSTFKTRIHRSFDGYFTSSWTKRLKKQCVYRCLIWCASVHSVYNIIKKSLLCFILLSVVCWEASAFYFHLVAAQTFITQNSSFYFYISKSNNKQG